MILLIDNYDSFSYNLYQLIGEINSDIKVFRNDKISIKEIYNLNPSHIFLSPGPGKAEDAGICIELVNEFSSKIPIFGVCLGYQAICEAYGGVISYAKKLMHGKTSEVSINNDSILFKDMDSTITCGRYHSLSLVEDSLPEELNIIAKSDNNEVMAIEHEKYPVYGVQFHPESILTPDGLTIIENFLKQAK